MNDVTDAVENVEPTGVIPTHRPEFLVQIVYKSGYIYTGLFEKLDTKTTGGKLTEISWALAPGNPHKIISIGLDSIESIIQLEDRLVEIEAQ